MAVKLPRRRFLQQISGVAAAGMLGGSVSGSVLAQSPDPAIEALANSLASGKLGSVVTPGSQAHRAIKFYNARFDCVQGTTYLQPNSRAGVQAIIAWAKQNDRKLAIRGGGHSFEGKSSHPGIVIDMSQMTGLTLREDGRLEVQAGVQLGKIYEALGPKNRILPAGTCPTVGIVGHALGGGIGDFTPMLGYAAQALREVVLVTMAGTALKVSDQAIERLDGPNIDTTAVTPAGLMRVLRGGGQGSLGVVTDMTFETHDLSAARLASFRFVGADAVSPERAIAILNAWQTWRQRQPEAMKTLVSSKVNYGRSGNRYSIEILGLIAIPDGSRISFDAVSRSLEPLRRLPEWRRKDISKPLSTTAAIATFLDDDDTTHNPRRRLLYGTSSVLRAALPRPALEYFVRNSPSQVYVSLYTIGGQTKSGPMTSLHPAEFLVEWVAWTRHPNPARHQQMKTVNLEMMRRAGFPPHAFPNYCEPEARDYFSNAEEIRRLAALFDPNGISTSSLLSDASRAWSAGACR